MTTDIIYEFTCLGAGGVACSLSPPKQKLQEGEEVGSLFVLWPRCLERRPADMTCSGHTQPNIHTHTLSRPHMHSLTPTLSCSLHTSRHAHAPPPPLPLTHLYPHPTPGCPVAKWGLSHSP